MLSEQQWLKALKWLAIVVHAEDRDPREGKRVRSLGKSRRRGYRRLKRWMLRMTKHFG